MMIQRGGNGNTGSRPVLLDDQSSRGALDLADLIGLYFCRGHHPTKALRQCFGLYMPDLWIH